MFGGLRGGPLRPKGWDGSYSLAGLLDQRHRRIAALVAVAALAAVGTAVLGNGPARPTGRRSSAVPTTSRGLTVPPPTRARPATTLPATTVPATPTHVQAPLAVGSTTLMVTRSLRRFDVQVLYPARQAGPAGAPLITRGPFPLIVFSPGFDIDPGAYGTLVGRWASLGFVVAVPHYPFTAAGAPGGVNESDIVQHPADLEATIDELITASSSPGTLLSRMIDPSRIGVAGHSDGGDVTDATVSNSCCRDPRIRAAAILSGAELTSFGGAYGSARVPLLVVQGDSDSINPPACSEQIYNTGGAARLYLDLRGAGHLPPYTAVPSGALYQEAVDQVTALFWAAYLDGEVSAASALAVHAGVASPASLTDGGPVAQSGTCPGAP